jgi:SNF2 family DNA or RNA helicase
MQYNRQHRQARQEVQQRRALLQRLADRKQGSHVLLDSSDSDSSEDGFGAESPAASSASEPHVVDAFQPTNVVDNDVLGGRKVLKRLSQQKENLPQAAQIQPLPTSGPRQGVLSACSKPDASDTRLLDSMAGLAIKDSVDKPRHAATKLAAAVATKLPDDMPDPSTIEASIQPLVKAASSHTAEHDTVSSQAAQFQLQPKIANMLYKHQTEGVHWLWSLHKMRRGGILGGQCAHAATACALSGLRCAISAWTHAMTKCLL